MVHEDRETPPYLYPLFFLLLFILVSFCAVAPELLPANFTERWLLCVRGQSQLSPKREIAAPFRPFASQSLG